VAAHDFYAVLGVPRNAGDVDLKKAYRNLARTYHPDKNPGDKRAEERFKEITEAYTVLSDPDKRAHYDRFGTAPSAGAGGGPDMGFSTIVEDLFESFGFFGGAGGGNRRQRAQRGDDLRYDLEISLEEAAEGVEPKLQIPRHEACEGCEGTGRDPGTMPEVCSSCRGQGQVRFSQGFLTVARPCPTCRGQGKINRYPCKACSGQGRLNRERLLKVTIPAGVEDGNQLRLSGEGEAGELGGPAGDLYVVIHIHAHELFAREGPHLLAELPITFSQAALGDTVEVPVLKGRAELTVPPGTQPGQRLVLKGKGMPHLRGRGKGDLHYEVVVEVPTHLSARQKEVLEEFRRVSEDEAGPRRSKFVERMKRLFGT
jgi:molecular chaperone DnaJ